MSSRSSINGRGEPPLKKARMVAAGSENAHPASLSSTSATIAGYYAVRKGTGGIRNCIFVSWNDAKHCLEGPENEQAVEYKLFDKMEDALGYIHPTPFVKTDAPVTAAPLTEEPSVVQQMVKNFGTQAVAKALVQASGIETVEKSVRAVRREQTEERLLLNKAEIWVNCIFPFVGIGSYAFVALISPRHRELYQEYFTANLAKDPRRVWDAQNNPPRVRDFRTNLFTREARATDTILSKAVFISLACAKCWDKDTEGNPHRLDDRGVWEQAVKAGSLEVVKWVHQRGLGHTVFFELPASLGHLEILKYLHENSGPWDLRMLRDVAYAAGGHLAVIKYLHEKGCPLDATTCSNAAGGGHLHILKWAHKKGCPWDQSTCSDAATFGHLETLRFAIDNGCNWDKDKMCEMAASSGNLELLKYVREEKGCEWDEQTCEEAIAGGFLEVLKYAHENGCPWNEEDVCANAASLGELEILKFLRQKGCSWDERTCANAAKWGCLDTLKWAHENGCRWDASTCAYAERLRTNDVFEWAKKNGCPYDPNYEVPPMFQHPMFQHDRLRDESLAID